MKTVFVIVKNTLILYVTINNIYIFSIYKDYKLNKN